MKKFLSLILTVLMLVSCAGCAASVPNDDSADYVGNMEDLSPTAVIANQETRVLPSDKAYVRGGKYAAKNWRVINQEENLDTNSEEILLIKGGTTGDYYRSPLFKFALSDIKNSTYNKVFFVPSFTYIDKSVDAIYFDLYKTSTSWNGDTVTYNTRPALSSSNKLATDVQISAMCAVDVTDAVKSAISSGQTSFSLCMTSATTHTNVCKINPGTSYLVATNLSSVSNYTYDLTGDDTQNEEIWTYAQTLVNDWYNRYLDLKDQPTFDAELIVSDEDEFNKTVYSGGSGFGNWTLDNVSKAYATRTYDALDDLGDYTDYADQAYDRDVYGGWMNPSMRQEVTGYFYSTKIDGRWWLIDPLGYPCYVLTMSGVGSSYLNSPNQKEAALFRYGSEEKFLISTVRWLKEDLGFNGGRETDVEEPLIKQVGMGIMSGYGTKIGTNASVGGSTVFSENNTMNVFEPGFVEYTNTKVETYTANNEDTWLLGYTTDNELPMDENMLANYLQLDITKVINGASVNHYSYAAAWSWLITMTGKNDASAADITPELLQLFRGFVYDRYFNVIRNAFTEKGIHQMFLGCRFLTKVKNAPWVLRFSSLYLDAMTINWYGQWTPSADDIYEITTNSDIPLMVTEFYTKALENDGSFDNPMDPLKNTRGAGWIVRTQQDRGDFYQNFTLRLLESKAFVGWQWHQYLDDDDSPEVIYRADGKTWRDQSNIDANKGIVNNWHEPYEELCSAMAEINLNAYRLALHFDAKYAQ